MNKQKRVLTIQDISCTGRCSLTVAFPIISAAGIEVAVIPTAVLSTHTGGFSGYTFRDLTDDIVRIEEHWLTLHRSFDAIYTGYLAPRQVDIVSSLIDRFKGEKTLVLVDPAMADGGKMYPGFDLAFARKMAGLVARADVTVPNLTEACFLLGKPYLKEYDRKAIEALLVDLSGLGPRYSILSGISYEKGKVGVHSYDKESGAFDYFSTEDIPGYYHGAGDIFASALTSGLVNGLSLAQSTRLAHDLVHASILATIEDREDDLRFGLHFERALKGFAQEASSLHTWELPSSK